MNLDQQAAIDGLERRELLRRGALGAGATAAALAMPSITGLGVAPAHGQGCSLPPAPPVITCAPAAATVCDDLVVATLTASNISPTGNTLVSDGVVDNLDGVELEVPALVAQTVPSICPGEQVDWMAEVTIDLCDLYNRQLEAAIAGSPIAVTDFVVRLTNISIGGVAVPDFAQDGTSMIAPCPLTIEIPVTASLPALADPFFDEIACAYECPPALGPGDVVVAPAPIAVSANLALEVQVAFFGARGGATATVAGPAEAPCEPTLGTVTCVP